MWSQIIIPILTMIIGIVCGASAMDMYKTNRWMEKIDRKIRLLEKKMEAGLSHIRKTFSGDERFFMQQGLNFV